MGELDPRSVSWGRIYAEAVAIAQDFTQRDPEDVVQLGITLVLEGEAPFDPDGGRTLAAHVVAVGLDARKNRERTERRRRRPHVVAKMQQYFDDDRPPPPDDLVEERERKARAADRLIAECADDPQVQALARLEVDGVNEPATQQERLGWSIELVRNVRKRLTRRVMALRARMDEEEEEKDPP